MARQRRRHLRRQNHPAVGWNARSVAIGEFNGDAKQDLVVAAQFAGESRVHVLLGNGDGTFAAMTDFAVGGDLARSPWRTSTAMARRTW